jgi:hypothetical protein
MTKSSKAERVTAAANADQIRAQADALRVQTRLDSARAAEERRARRREAAEGRRQRRRARRAEQRARLNAVLFSDGGRMVQLVAVGSPAIIAWKGQYEFAHQVMGLGHLSVLLPVAVEGAVLYAAHLAHQAITAKVSAARYRMMTWLLAAVASGLNFWHGLTRGGHSLGSLTAADLQVGVSLGLTSLLGIGLLELTTALRSHIGRAESRSSAAQIRRTIIRWIRYPVLSAQAAGIRAASGIDVDQAWLYAWTDRYGIGPGNSRRARRLGKQVLKQQDEDCALAAASGDLAIVDGTIVPIAVLGDREQDHPDEHPSPARVYLQGGMAQLDELLQARAAGCEDQLDLPPAPREPSALERAGELPDGDKDAADHAIAQPQEDDGADSSAGSCDGPAADGCLPAGESTQRRRMAKKANKRSKKSATYEQRLDAVRALLKTDPQTRPPDITRELGIPAATARRLFRQVISELEEQ